MGFPSSFILKYFILKKNYKISLEPKLMPKIMRNAVVHNNDN